MAAAGPAGISKPWEVRERRQSLIFDIIVLGEALAKVSAQTKALGSRVPWRIINGTRNRLIHAYWLHDRDFVQEVVASHLPPLLAQLDELINMIGPDP